MSTRLRVELPLESTSNDWRSGPDVLAARVAEVEDVCRKVSVKSGAHVRVGRCVSTKMQTEVGVFIEKGSRVGVFAGLCWKPGNAVAQLTIGPGSRTHGQLQWGALVTGLVAAAVIGWAFGPYAQPVVALSAILIGGVALGVVAMRVIIARGIGIDADASAKLAKRVVARLAPRA